MFSAGKTLPRKLPLARPCTNLPVFRGLPSLLRGIQKGYPRIPAPDTYTVRPSSRRRHLIHRSGVPIGHVGGERGVSSRGAGVDEAISSVTRLQKTPTIQKTGGTDGGDEIFELMKLLFESKQPWANKLGRRMLPFVLKNLEPDRRMALEKVVWRNLISGQDVVTSLAIFSHLFGFDYVGDAHNRREWMIQSIANYMHSATPAIRIASKDALFEVLKGATKEERLFALEQFMSVFRVQYYSYILGREDAIGELCRELLEYYTEISGQIYEWQQENLFANYEMDRL